MLGWELPPHNSGGLGVACYQACKTLSAKGVDIEFVLPYDAPHDIEFMKVTPAHPQGVTEIIKSGIAYDSYKYIMEDGSEEWVDIFNQQLMYEKSVDRLVESLEFDVIHAHDWLTFRAAVRAKTKTGRPLILHFHSTEYDRAGGNSGNPLVHDIEQIAISMADRVIAVSEHTKRAIVSQYGIPASMIEVIHNSIDVSDLERPETNNAFRYLEAMKPLGYKVVANVGRLTIQKGLINFLHAAKIVIDHNPKVFFLIAGTGEQDYELIELAANLGISRNAIFTGFLRGKEWRDAFAIADLFVLPSVSEPFGLTPLEAAGYGTPSLISKQSGVAEVFRSCLKVDFWDTNEMANQMTAVLQNEGLHAELSKSAYHEYLGLSWDSAAKRLQELYDYHVDGAAA